MPASVASKPRWSLPETVKLVTDVAVRSLLINERSMWKQRWNGRLAG